MANDKLTDDERAYLIRLAEQEVAEGEQKVALWGGEFPCPEVVEPNRIRASAQRKLLALLKGGSL